MIYLLGALALYLLAILWIGYIGPVLDRDIAELKRRDAERDEAWRKRQEELIKREEDRLRREQEQKKPEVGDFLKFDFPIIRRANPALVAPQIVSVQPMTAPVGGIAFYRSQYAQEELRTVLDDIVDALDEDDELERTDPVRRCTIIAEQIVWKVFKDHPYSTYYKQPKPCVGPPSIKGPPVQIPETRTDLAHRVGSLLQGHEAAARTLLDQESTLSPYLRKWSSILEGTPQAKLLEAHLEGLVNPRGR